ncbi:hypothetical protein [Jannaschia marina]|uniref:hypothetical protein n=1 Tax=Jannaschia marina TaxID=2741674 RepID=UPI0015C73AED|nr:hypothetical protein [Jannaschia marina]
MKYIVLCAALALATPALAAAPATGTPGLGAQEVSHDGGCRKNSPPGQCCHAGSQPLHCH